MALRITRANEPIEVKNIKILIYGQPGVWKTSLAFTASKPLLLDFDKGAYRSEFRKDIVQIESWKDVIGMSENDLEPYDTICVDTVGRLLDDLTSHIINENPKLARSSGALTLQGYGELKSNYAQWLKRLIGYGKDVVLIAHDKEDKKGDDLIVRPDIQGGSYGEVFKQADSVGYIYRSARGNVLNFSPTDSTVGKNIGHFEPFILPNFHQKPNFLAEIIEQIKQSMSKLSEEGLEIQAKVENWRSNIDSYKSAEEINQAIEDVKKIKNKAIQVQVKHLLANKAKELELEYEGEKGKGKYVEKQQAEAA